MILRSFSFMILVSKHVRRVVSIYLKLFSMPMIKVLHCICYLHDISKELTHAHSSRINYCYYYYYYHHHLHHRHVIWLTSQVYLNSLKVRK
jgi:branched-subunit amino acid transport protein AzlD